VIHAQSGRAKKFSGIYISDFDLSKYLDVNSFVESVMFGEFKRASCGEERSRAFLIRAGFGAYQHRLFYLMRGAGPAPG